MANMKYLLTSAWFAVVLIAQDNPATRPQDTFRQAITVVAIDARSHQVCPVVPEQMTISGVSAVPLSAEHIKGPRHVVLLIDVSSSSRTNQVRWQNTLLVARELLQHNTQDWIALHVFADVHRALTPFTRDTSVLLKALDTLSPENSQTIPKAYGYRTNVIDALEKCLAMSGPDLHFGDEIVLVSDGEYPDLNRKKQEEAQRELIRLGLRLYLLHTGDLIRSPIVTSTSSDPIQSSARQKVEYSVTFAYNQDQRQLVVPTGGAVVSAHEPAAELPITDRWLTQQQAVKAVRVLFVLIHNGYRVDLEIRELISKPRRFTLRLKNSQGGNVEAHYPFFILPEGQFRGQATQLPN